MKKLQFILIGLSLCATLQLRAQLFTPESVGGAAVGGIAGALIGGDHHAGEGAAIGAGAGFLLGALVHQDRQRYYGPYYPSPYYGYYGPYSGYYYYPPAVTTQVAAAPAPAQPKAEPPPPPPPQPSSPMSGVNALFGR